MSRAKHYSEIIDQFNNIYESHEKQAMENYNDHDVFDSNIREMKPQGETPKPKVKGETDLEHSTPEGQDNLQKSVAYQQNPRKKDEKVTQTNQAYLKNQGEPRMGYDYKGGYNKKADDADLLLDKIQTILSKRAMEEGEEDEDREKKKMKEKADDMAYDEEEVMLDEEDEEYIKKHNLDKEAYLREKRAGAAFFNSLDENSLQFINNLTHIKAGQMVAHMEQQGQLFTKEAAYKMVASAVESLEKKGHIKRAHQGRTLEQEYLMIKEAARQKTREVLNDISMRRSSSEIENLLGRLGN